jgi:hypothetical protein
MAAKGGQGFLAHVMFDAFSVRLGNRLRNPQGFQKIQNNDVTLPGFFRELSTRIGQENRAIWLGRHQSISLQSLNGATDGYMCYAQAARQVDDPCFARCGNQLRNHLHVILCQFLRMLLPRSPRAGRGCVRASLTNFTGSEASGFHSHMKPKGHALDKIGSICTLCYITCHLINSVLPAAA